MLELARRIGSWRPSSSIGTTLLHRTLLAVVIGAFFLCSTAPLQAAGDRRDTKRAEELADERTDFIPGQPSLSGTQNTWWVPAGVPGASSSNLRGVTYLPTGVVWLSGYQTSSPFADVVWKSTDNGQTWTQYSVPSGAVGITGVAACDENVAMVGTSAGQILRTTNGGSSWDIAFSYAGISPYIDAIQWVAGDTLVALGDADDQGLLVIRSTDRGATWIRSTNLPAEEKTANKYYAYATYSQGMDVFGRTIWMPIYSGSGVYPRILKSTDAGATWNSWAVTLTGSASYNYYIRSINFLNDSLGFIVSRAIAVSGSDSWMHKTTNGGLTFSDTLNFQQGILHQAQRPRSVKPIRGTDTVIAVGFNSTNGPKVWQSSDRGATWASMDPSGSGALTNSAFLSSSTGLIVGLGQAYTPISGPYIILNTPNGGENWRGGWVKNITWSSRDVSNVAIDYSTDSGGAWTTVTPSTSAAPGSFAWTIPAVTSSQCFVRVSDASNPSVNDRSDVVFTIAATAPTAETEPNNTASQANYIEIGDSLDATITPNTDVDYYKFTAVAGDTVEIVAYARNGSSLEGQLVLFDSGGSQLRSSYWNYRQRLGYVITVSGTYYVRYTYAGNGTSFPTKTIGEAVSPGKRPAWSVWEEARGAQAAAERTGTKASLAGSRRGTEHGAEPEILQSTPNPTAPLADTGDYRIVLRRFIAGPPILGGMWSNNVKSNAMQFTGQVDPNGLPTTVSFQYGTTTGYGSTLQAIENPLNGVGGYYGASSPTINGLSPSTVYHVRMVASNSAGIVYGPDFGLSTLAAPEGWAVQSSPSSNSLFGVAMRTADSAVAVGDMGVSLYTTNGGDSWLQSSNQGTIWLFAVASFAPGKAIAVGGNGTIRRTTDGGASWTGVASNSSSDLFGAAFGNSLRGLVVGASGTVLMTTDGGITWTSQTSGTTELLIGVCFTDDTTAFVAGSNGTIRKTTNGGAAWTSQVSGTPNQLWSVTFNGRNNGYAVGDNSTILRTSNGGAAWSGQTPTSEIWCRDVAMVDSSVTWIIGYNGMIEKTTDAGLTWVVVPSGTSSSLLSMDVTPSGDATIVGDQGTILRSTGFVRVASPNGGENWRIGTVRNIQWTSRNVSSLAINYSTDAGGSWIPVTPSTAASVGSFAWTIPSAVSGQCLVRVSDASNVSLNDQSDAVFSIVATAVTAETEPNNSASLADYMEYGDSLDASINPNTDVDYYKFNAAGGDTVDIVAHTLDGSYLNGRITLFDASGNHLDQTWYWMSSLRLVVKVPSTGIYYIRYCYIQNATVYPNGTHPAVSEQLLGVRPPNRVESDTGAYRIILKKFVLSPPVADGVGYYYRYSTAMKLGGRVDPGGLPTTVTFEYGTSPSYGSSIAAEQFYVNGFIDGYAISPEITGLSPGTTYYARLKAQNSLGIAYGYQGILSTPPASDRWVRQVNQQPTDFYGVARLSERRIVVTGYYYDIFWSSDGGGNWSAGTGFSNGRMSIASVDSLTAVIVNEFGSIFRSTNGGATWATVPSPTGESLIAVHFSDLRNGTAVGTNGKVLRSNDGGLSWILQSTSTTKHLRGVFASDSLHVCAVGDSGTILQTTDAGATWAGRTSGVGTILYGVSFATPQFGVAAGEQGTIVRTSDGGTSWASVVPPTYQQWYALAFADSLTGRIVGDAGIMLVTTDRGATWNTEESGTVNYLRAIAFYGSSHGTVVGYMGTILDFTAPACKTVSLTAGWNMVSVPLSQPSMAVNAAFPGAISSAFGFSGDYASTPTLSLAYGYWLKFAGSGSRQFCGTAVAPRDIPVVAGWNMIGSYDLESSVGSVTSIPSGIVNSPFYGYASGYQAAATLLPGKAYWVLASQAGTLRIPNVYMKSGDIQLYAYNEWPAVLFEDPTGGKSTLYLPDAKELEGKSFDLPPVPPSGVLDVRFANNRNVVACAMGSYQISVSADDLPLKIRASNLKGTKLRIRDAIDGTLISHILSEGAAVTIIHPPSALLLEVLEGGGEIPTEYSLSQNYPNPFNPSTMIRFGLPAAGRVNITLFNLLGSAIATLVNGELPAGFHEVSFDAAHLASGTYFYRIEAGTYRQVRKMMILK